MLDVPTGDFIVSGKTSCSASGSLDAATCLTACDASNAPANGGVGDCPAALARGETCQPTCDPGYTPSGPTTCYSECTDETQWPNVYDQDSSGNPHPTGQVICGDCKVLVTSLFSYQSCDKYCESIGKTCVGAWKYEDDADGWPSCAVDPDKTRTCSESKSNSKDICECSKESA